MAGPTVFAFPFHERLLHRPRIVAPPDDVDEGKVGVAVKGVQEPEDAVDDE